MFDKDSNKIGEATADEMGHAIVVPTVNIPEGNVQRKRRTYQVMSQMLALNACNRGGSTDTNNAKGSVVAQTTVKPSPVVDVSSDSSDKHMNLSNSDYFSSSKDTSFQRQEKKTNCSCSIRGFCTAFDLPWQVSVKED